MTGSLKYWVLPLRSKPLEDIRGRWGKAAKKWSGSVNYPFSGSVDKPRESLSKHDNDPKRSHLHWHVDDVVFVTSAHKDMELLLQLSGKSITTIKEMFDAIKGLDASLLPPSFIERFSSWDREVKEIMKLAELSDDFLD
jgi:hypothetical protein